MMEIQADDLLIPAQVERVLNLPAETALVVWFSGAETLFAGVLFTLRQRFFRARFALRLRTHEGLETFAQKVPFWILQRMHMDRVGAELEPAVQRLREKGGLMQTLGRIDEIRIAPVAESAVLTIWQQQLWPERSDIRRQSSMTFPTGYDMSIYQKFMPTFFGATVDGTLVAVNSGHRTSAADYRSRGLWVAPSYRRQGIAGQLLHAAEAQARIEGARRLWSFPRLAAMPVYQGCGLQQVGAPTETHCTVVKELDAG